jgi:hypothetical protein
MKSLGRSFVLEGTYALPDLSALVLLPPRRYIVNRGDYAGSPSVIYWLSPDEADPTGQWYTRTDVPFSSLTNVIKVGEAQPVRYR